MLAYIGEIAERLVAISRHTLSSEVDRLFSENESLEGIVVLEETNPLGLVMRTEFYQRIARKYGFDLFMGRPIELVMNRDPLILDYYTPIVETSQLAMNRGQKHLYDYVIVQKNGTFFGTVSIKVLLLTFAEIQTANARFTNPLTGLPGNQLIEEHLNTIIHTGQFSILYFDLDHFKTYNDTYGFRQGDIMLQRSARLLAPYFTAEHAFFGHIGGDDFIGIVPYHEQIEQLCETIIAHFATMLPEFYHEDDWQRGFVIAQNRKQVTEQIPLVSLSIAVVTNRKETTFTSASEISETAAQMKKLCKQMPSHSYVVNTSLAYV